MNHAAGAASFLLEDRRSARHDAALWAVRQKRDRAAAGVPDWESLRQHASAIKAHTITHLDRYLRQFEESAVAHGIHVHWAEDAEEHNRIVHGLLTAHHVQRLVKSKSMLTEECGLNHYLEAQGIEVVDSDLGERIVQLRKEHPTHIVLPAIHTDRNDIAELFQKHLGSEPGNNDPVYLTREARRDLRARFLSAEAALTGVNFAIAETGSFVVCTNEGNADLGCALPKLHIACMGMEKLIPTIADLAVFTRLLARSATGQPITTYTAHYNAPQSGCELHVVIVDNGRSRILSDDVFRPSLHCIRCGACLNTCPVYRRSGGKSYRATIPGPIGSVLSPWRDPAAHHDLPYASTLCGSCTDVCPVRINLHEQLLAWRRKLVAEGHAPRDKRVMISLLARVLANRRLYDVAGKAMRFLGRMLPATWLAPRWTGWGSSRDLPPLPRRSFREEMARRKDRHDQP
jgi:L-lactate dehydrogenase complex protein LldF